MNKQVFADKFEIQGEIAQGATGTIYYGYDLELRQEVAIKIYHSHINGRLIRGKNFVEKTKPLLKLDHPNLIKIFKVEEDNDTPIVFMEFFDGPSLQQIIREKGPLSVEHMLILAQGIAEVLVHTHFQGIIHGTLHPGHVLVGPQNQIKVMDLGLSWILMDILSNCDEDLLRPLPYLPPESAKGDLLTLSSDLYSLGFMMYEMLTKTTPYAGFPKTSIMGKLAFDQSDPPFDFPESVPSGVRDLIYQITRNKPQNRLQDATHVLTIINQQLTRLNPNKQQSTQITQGIRKPKEAQPHPTTEAPASKTTAPASETPTPTPMPIAAAPDPTTSAPAKPVPTAPSPSLEQYSFKKKVAKPSSSNGWMRNLGFILGILLLMAGAYMGYWFRDALNEPSTPLPAPRPSPTTKELSPAPPVAPPPIQPSGTVEEPMAPTPPQAIQERLPQGPQGPEAPTLISPVNKSATTENISSETPATTTSAKSGTLKKSPSKKQGQSAQTKSSTTTPNKPESATTVPKDSPVIPPQVEKPAQQPAAPTSSKTDIFQDPETQQLLDAVGTMEDPVVSQPPTSRSPELSPEPQN